MNPLVTISLEYEHGKGKTLRAQTQFAFSQRHTPEAKAAIDHLHARLVREAKDEPRGVLCSDGMIHVRKL